MKPDESHPDLLEDFVAGKKNEAENALILDHLAVCERCTAEVESLWAKSPARHILPKINPADPETVDTLEESLFRRIHRSELGGQIIRLGTQGFAYSILALFRPILAGRRPSRQGGIHHDRT